MRWDSIYEFVFSSLQHSQALLNARRVSFPVWTLSAVLTRLLAVTGETSVPQALMRRTVQLLRVVWSLTGPVETTSASPKSCAATDWMTAWITLTKRAVVRNLCHRKLNVSQWNCMALIEWSLLKGFDKNYKNLHLYLSSSTVALAWYLFVFMYPIFEISLGPALSFTTNLRKTQQFKNT